MNDVFIGIWNNTCYFDPTRSSFKNWAAGIARYKALDYLKKTSAYQSRNQEIPIDFPQNDPEIENAVESHLSEETEALLQCLKPKDRELFRKIYIEDKPIDTVKKVLYAEKEADHELSGQWEFKFLVEGGELLADTLSIPLDDTGKGPYSGYFRPVGAE